MKKLVLLLLLFFSINALAQKQVIKIHSSALAISLEVNYIRSQIIFGDTPYHDVQPNDFFVDTVWTAFTPGIRLDWYPVKNNRRIALSTGLSFLKYGGEVKHRIDYGLYNNVDLIFSFVRFPVLLSVYGAGYQTKQLKWGFSILLDTRYLLKAEANNLTTSTEKDISEDMKKVVISNIGIGPNIRYKRLVLEYTAAMGLSLFLKNPPTDSRNMPDVPSNEKFFQSVRLGFYLTR